MSKIQIDNHSLPVYERIAGALRSAIRRRALPRGTVLLEGPVAAIFRSSRSPVRQALTQLHAEGLISRFEGRGMIVGKGDDAALRLSIDAAMLGLEDALGDFTRVPAWQRVYDQIENDLVNQSVLGASRINEFELAQHYSVSRTVANQVMLRAEANGIVVRDDVGRWSIVPMDTQRLRNIYDVRRLLEPEAIYGVVRHAPPELVAGMLQRLETALAQYPKVSSAALDALEVDLHVDCISLCGNPELLKALRSTRCAIILSKHALGASVPYPKADPFIEEHYRVIKALRDGTPAHAKRAMAEHLDSACDKVVSRLEVLRKSTKRIDLPYLSLG